MPKLNTTVKAVRVDNEVLEKFEEKLKGQSVSSWLNQQIEDFVDDSARFSQNSGSKTGKPVSDMGKLDEMAMCFGVSSEEMLSKVVEALENGEFTFVGGKIVAVEEPWVDAFRETCHDLCIPVEKACESAIKALRRGI